MTGGNTGSRVCVTGGNTGSQVCFDRLEYRQSGVF